MESASVQAVLVMIAMAWLFLLFVCWRQRRYIAVMVWVLSSFWGMLITICCWRPFCDLATALAM